MAPAGLDGNPDPIRTPARTAVLDAVAGAVEARLLPDRALLVGIDGIDGAGKSTFADELGAALRDRGVAIVRSTIDSFHHPRAIRWRKGRRPPEGFYRDSHDLDAVRRLLLDPVRSGAGTGVTAAFDEPADAPLQPAPDPVPLEPRSAVLFDGIFLHRPELAPYWDLSLYLDGEERVRRQRIELATGGCPPGGPTALLHLAGWWSVLARYVRGMQLYLDECAPAEVADVVVANDDLSAPRITSGAAQSQSTG